MVAGQKILNTLSNDHPIAVDFAVDQKEVYRFMQLQQQGNHAKDSTFSIAFGTDVYPYPGSISLIDRAVDAQTGTIKTRLVFPNNKNMLKPGMNTSVRVKNNNSAKSIVIPYKAVTEQLGEFFVYVLGDSSKVTQRKVLLGKQIVGNIIVTGHFSSDSISFGTTVLTNAGFLSNDMFIVKYDPNGNVLWATSAGGTQVEIGFGCSTDCSCNVK